jgi:peptidoglycan/xylan/chitin deacetylase (PgdA/CDA1 family)
MGVSVEAFTAHVRHVAHRLHPVGIDEVLEARRSGRPLPRGSVMFTFDDAYRDVAEHAWPVMQAHGVPALLFVPTAYPDTANRFWWDRLHHALTASDARSVSFDGGSLTLASTADRDSAYRVMRDALKRLPHDEAMMRVDGVVAELAAGPPPAMVLGWDELRALSDDGVALAAHSRTHPLLDRVPQDQARQEIEGSLDDLRTRLGRALPVFAYPGGHVDESLVRAAADAGVEVAFTTASGLNDPARAQWLELRRVNVGRRTSVPVLRSQLHPVMSRVLERVG